MIPTSVIVWRRTTNRKIERALKYYTRKFRCHDQKLFDGKIPAIPLDFLSSTQPAPPQRQPAGGNS